MNILWGLKIPFMLQMVIVCVGEGRAGWISGGEGEGDEVSMLCWPKIG